MFKSMHAFYDFLIDKYGANNEIRMFFTTEPFSNRTGYHNHFVLYISNQLSLEAIKSDLADFFPFDRVEVEKYNRYEGGLFYSVKNGCVNEDWDVLGNMLSTEQKDGR